MSAPLWLIAAALALYAGSLFEQALRPLQSVTPPAQIGSLSAEDCAPCHATIYEQWKTSRHRQSWSNSIFAASFQQEPMSWCIYCHAPLPAQVEALTLAQGPGTKRRATVPTPLVAEGITCAVCHIRDGFILSAGVPSRAALLAHPARQAAQLARAEFCGGCHQFNVPYDDPPLRYTAEPMQDTLSEWQRAAASEQGQRCQDCHMPRGSHAFPGAHNREFLRAAISARVERLTDGGIAVRLRAQGVGHNVPTGDPFRRLRLLFCSEPTCAEPLSELPFGRIFRKVDGGSRVIADWTIPPTAAGQAAERSLVIHELGSEATSWRLIYSYAASGTERYLPTQDIAVELARDRIAPARAK